MRKGFVQEYDGTITVPLENIWARARQWAKRHGHAVTPFLVVGIAPF